jgi:hypothetical protein
MMLAHKCCKTRKIGKYIQQNLECDPDRTYAWEMTYRNRARRAARICRIVTWVHVYCDVEHVRVNEKMHTCTMNECMTVDTNTKPCACGYAFAEDVLAQVKEVQMATCALVYTYIYRYIHATIDKKTQTIIGKIHTTIGKRNNHRAHDQPEHT